VKGGSQGRKERGRTVVFTQDQPVDRVQSEETEEVPRDGGTPRRVEVGNIDTALEEFLEFRREGEGESG
jgi:hypothetical protein